jgi:hypothetical protein
MTTQNKNEVFENAFLPKIVVKLAQTSRITATLKVKLPSA